MQGKKATKNEGIPRVSGVSKGFNFYATRFPGILFAKKSKCNKNDFLPGAGSVMANCILK